jgi:hypothetical protein
LSVQNQELSSKAVKTEHPSTPLDGGFEMVLWRNKPRLWSEIPEEIVFARRAGSAVEKFQMSFWAITAVSEGLKKGDRSLCEVFGIDPEGFASALRNADVPSSPMTGASKAPSEQQGNSPAVHDDSAHSHGLGEL